MLKKLNKVEQVLLAMADPNFIKFTKLFNNISLNNHETLLLRMASSKLLYDSVVKKNEIKKAESQKIFNFLIDKINLSGINKFILLDAMFIFTYDQMFFFEQFKGNKSFETMINNQGSFFLNFTDQKLKEFENRNAHLNKEFEKVYLSFKKINDFLKINHKPIDSKIEKLDLIRPNENTKTVFFNLSKIIEVKLITSLIYFNIPPETSILKIKQLKPRLVKLIKHIDKNQNQFFCNIGCLFNDLYDKNDLKEFGTNYPIDSNRLSLLKNLNQYEYQENEYNFSNTPSKQQLSINQNENIFHAIFTIKDKQLCLSPAKVSKNLNDQFRRKKHTDLAQLCVDTAGEVFFRLNKENKLEIIAINNGSGHFLPTLSSVETNIYKFKELGFSLNNYIKIYNYDWHLQKELIYKEKKITMDSKKNKAIGENF